jgi:hypothetical protein
MYKVVNAVSTLIAVVDPGSFSGIEGYILHVIPRGLCQSTSRNCPIAIDFDFCFP